MSITLIGYITIPLLIILTFKLKLKDLLIITFIISTMTSTTVLTIDILDFSLPIGYFLGICMTLKYLICNKTKIIVSKLLTLFIISIILSLFLPIIYSEGTVVLTPNDKYEALKFNFQMITQFIYLLFMFIIFTVSVNIMINEKFNNHDFYLMIKYSLILTIILSIIQYILPSESFNSIFRTGHMNNQMINGVVRITAATMEASILSLVLVPMLIYMLNNILHKFVIVDFLLVVATIVILMQSKSTSFFIGFIIGIILFTCNLIRRLIINKKRINLKQLILLYFAIIIIFIVILPIKNKILIEISNLIDSAIYKLNGNGISGSGRSLAFKHHMDIFFNNILIGVGFGTVRSYDLFSTWICELGIIGITPFVLFNIIITSKLIFNKVRAYSSIAFLIIVEMSIMMISVPEPYYVFTWIYYAYAYYICNYLKDINIILKTN